MMGRESKTSFITAEHYAQDATYETIRTGIPHRIHEENDLAAHLALLNQTQSKNKDLKFISSFLYRAMNGCHRRTHTA